MSLPGHSPDHLGSVAPTTWKRVLEGPALEVAEGLLDQITALRNTGLTGRTVLRVFLFRRILSLMARPAPMWEYLGLGDQSAVAEGHLQRSL